MRAMWALLLREWRLLWAGPTGLLLPAAWVALTGALFLLELTSFEDAQQRALVLDDPVILGLLDFNTLLLPSLGGHLLLLLLFVAPLLAMRVFADEGRHLRWWLGQPVSLWTFVVGKVGGVALGLLMLLAWLAIFPILLMVFGQGPQDGVVDLGHAALVGGLLALVGFAYVATVAAVGALVEGALPTALLSFLLLLGLWLAPAAAPVVGGRLGAALLHISPASHAEGMLRGTVVVADVAHFAVWIAAALLLAAFGLRARLAAL